MELALGTDWYDDPWARAGLTLLASVVAAVLLDQVFFRIAGVVAGRTRSELDDKLVAMLRRPVAVTVVLVGLWVALQDFDLPAPFPFVIEGMLFTTGAVYWTLMALRLQEVVLDALGTGSDDRPGVVQPRTRPLLDFMARVFVLGGGIYFLFLGWQIDLTAWLASAGIIGIAVGFAAKDTLANLFAGIFILADAPYKIGHYLVIDTGERGRVVEIGLRSTRLLTRDQVEVIIPNAQMAASRIVNVSGGPSEAERVRTEVQVAYGSDLPRVRHVLIECAEACPHALHEEGKGPRVELIEFADSGLTLHLKFWIPIPELRGLALDDVNTRIYERFAEEGIEIPYPTRDLNVRRWSPPGQGE